MSSVKVSPTSETGMSPASETRLSKAFRGGAGTAVSQEAAITTGIPQMPELLLQTEKSLHKNMRVQLTR